MNNKILAVILIVPFLCLAGWVMYLTVQRETGQEVTVAVAGYDPRDLLSGHYIQYTIDWNRTDCSQFENAVCPKDAFCKEARWGRQCRFYVPENSARELDSLFWSRNTTDMVFEIIYAYKEGTEPIAKQMLINGKDWRDALDKNLKKKSDFLSF